MPEFHAKIDVHTREKAMRILRAVPSNKNAKDVSRENNKTTSVINKSPSINLKVVYANIRGLNSKVASIKDLLSEVKPCIALFTETHLTNNKGANFKGYAFFGRPREEKSGGGVAIIVRNDKKRSIAPHYSTRKLEILWVSVARKNEKPLYLGVYYGKQEKENMDEIREEMENLTEEIQELKRSGEIILCMDANAKIGLLGEPISRNGRLMNEMMCECDLEVINRKQVCQGKIVEGPRRGLQ